MEVRVMAFLRLNPSTFTTSESSSFTTTKSQLPVSFEDEIENLQTIVVLLRDETVAVMLDSSSRMSLTFTELVLKSVPVTVTVVVVPRYATDGLMDEMADDSALAGIAMTSNRAIARENRITKEWFIFCSQ
jgi:hypothetical protein